MDTIEQKEAKFPGERTERYGSVPNSAYNSEDACTVRKTYAQVKNHVDKMMENKRLNSERDIQLCERLQSTLTSEGFGHFLDDKSESSTISESSSAVRERRETKSSVSRSSKFSMASISAPRIQAPALPQVRGLRAFDLALNPHVENMMRHTRYRLPLDPYNPLASLVPHTGGKPDSTEPINRGSKKEKVLNRDQMKSANVDDAHEHSVKQNKTRKESSVVKNHRRSSSPRLIPRSLRFKSVLRLKDKRDHHTASPATTDLPWLNERLRTSCRTVRFGIPMDLLELENMSCQQYLLKHCHIERNREIHYRKIFDTKMSKLTKAVTFKQMEGLLSQVLVGEVDSADIKSLLTVLNMSNQTTPSVSFRLFSVVCAVGERILYVCWGGRNGMVGVNRTFLENADFCGLVWRLRDLHMEDPYLRRLLMSLG